MSLFRPFARRPAEFRASRESAPPPKPVATAERGPAATPAPAPAPNHASEETPDDAPERSVHRAPQADPDRVAVEAAVTERELALRQELQAEWTRAVDALGVAERLAETLQETRRETIRDSADVIGEIVTNLAERLIGGTLAVSAEAVAKVVRDAADALPSDAVRVRLSPADVERVRSLVPEKLAAVLEADPTIQGGCVAETKRASVDATLDAAREGLRSAIAEWDQERDR